MEQAFCRLVFLVRLLYPPPRPPLLSVPFLSSLLASTLLRGCPCWDGCEGTVSHDWLCHGTPHTPWAAFVGSSWQSWGLGLGLGGDTREPKPSSLLHSSVGKLCHAGHGGGCCHPHNPLQLRELSGGSGRGERVRDAQPWKR